MKRSVQSGAVFLPSYRTEQAEPGSADRTAFVLHGILGSSRNWRSVGRALAKRLPGWAFVLVDLRNHGESHGAPRPHTVAACADDLAALAERLGEPPAAVIGHSFGGKVALSYAQRHGEELAAAWILDSNPGPRALESPLASDVVRVIAALAELEMPLAARLDVVPALVNRGFSSALASWMTTNLRRTDRGFAWRFDLDGVRELLVDYASADFTEFIGDAVADLHFVWGEHSGQWTPELQRSLVNAPTATHHVLEGAGHWVHADAPDALVELLVEGLG